MKNSSNKSKCPCSSISPLPLGECKETYTPKVKRAKLLVHKETKEQIVLVDWSPTLRTHWVKDFFNKQPK